MHRQKLKLLLTDDLLLQGHWGKEDAAGQRTSFNTLDNWGHKTPTQSKTPVDRKEKVNPSLISLMVSMDVKHHVYLLKQHQGRGGGGGE